MSASKGWLAHVRLDLDAVLDPAATSPPARAFRSAQRIAIAVGLGTLILGTVPELAAAHQRALTVLILIIAGLVTYVAFLNPLLGVALLVGVGVALFLHQILG